MKKGIFALVILFSFNIGLEAKLLQILHTNDIHSRMMYNLEDTNRGGYATMKTMVDQFRYWAGAQGIPTVFLDGGDYLEGSLLYMSKQGQSVIRVMEEMGYDAIVVGNHDYLMGTAGLDKLFGQVKPKVPFLAANYKFKSKYKNLKKYMHPYTIIEKEGMRIGVVGSTTDSLLYKWRAKNGGKIKSKTKYVYHYAKKLKEEHGCDIVIALTHIGQKSDRKLAKGSRYVDVIVGGHSHDALYQVVYEKNLYGKKVPIVQTGSWGENLGRLWLDVEPGYPVNVVDYKLEEVWKDEHPADPIIEEMVQDSYHQVIDFYGEEWIKEVIAQTEIPLENDDKKHTIWGDLIADAMRESFDADLSVHTPKFAAASIPPGPITREDIINAYPRFFDFEDSQGWYVYRSKVFGFLLKPIIKVVVATGLPLYFSGVSFKIKNVAGVKIPYNLRIKGKKMRWWKSYDVAFPEGIVRGGLGISGLVKLLLRKSKNMKYTMWQSLEDKLKSVGTVKGNTINEYDKKMRKDGRIIERMMIPQWKDIDE